VGAGGNGRGFVLMDQFIWRPVITGRTNLSSSRWKRGSAQTPFEFHPQRVLPDPVYRSILHPVVEWLTLQFARGALRAAATIKANPAAKPRRWYGWFLRDLQ